MNNLDVIILIIVGISALIAYSRGLIKEVLSIVGWILGCIAVIYLLPILNPITMEYVKNGTFAGVLTAVAILILFLVCWVLFTAKIVGKVRTSKLGGLDRMLGLFFGIARACLLIILCYILIGWVVPPEKQSPILQESKYYTLAGTFADPIENLIPEETLEKIKNSSFLSTPKKEKASEEKTIEENKVKEKAHKIEKEKEQELILSSPTPSQNCILARTGISIFLLLIPSNRNYVARNICSTVSREFQIVKGGQQSF